MKPAPILPAELADLQAVHASLTWLSRKPWSVVAANPMLVGCLRNVLAARRRRRAKDVAFIASQPFELAP